MSRRGLLSQSLTFFGFSGSLGLSHEGTHDFEVVLGGTSGMCGVAYIWGGAFAGSGFLPVIVLPTLASAFPGAATTLLNVDGGLGAGFFAGVCAALSEENGCKSDQPSHRVGLTPANTISIAAMADKTRTVLTTMIVTLRDGLSEEKETSA